MFFYSWVFSGALNANITLVLLVSSPTNFPQSWILGERSADRIDDKIDQNHVAESQIILRRTKVLGKNKKGIR